MREVNVTRRITYLQNMDSVVKVKQDAVKSVMENFMEMGGLQVAFLAEEVLRRRLSHSAKVLKLSI